MTSSRHSSAISTTRLHQQSPATRRFTAPHSDPRFRLFSELERTQGAMRFQHHAKLVEQRPFGRSLVHHGVETGLHMQTYGGQLAAPAFGVGLVTGDEMA